MVDLPQVPRRLAVTEAPTSLVTREDAAAPGKALGTALSSLGSAVDDAAVVVAQNEAQKAVTRDADGNLQVQLLPDFMGRAGRVFNETAKQSYLAQLDVQARDDLAKAHLDNQGNPDEFKVFADNYIDGLVGKQSDAGMQNAVRQRLTQVADQHYRGLQSQRASLDLRRANDALDSQILTAADDLEKLTRQGAPQEDVTAAIGRFDGLLKQKVDNPLLSYSREHADRLRDEVMTRAYGGAVLDGVERAYQQGGYQAAVDHLNKAAGDLDGTIKQAAKIRQQGLAWLRGQESAFRGERDAISREWATARDQAETLPRATLLDMKDRADAVGAVRVSNDIAVRMAAVDTVTALRGLPASERAAIAVSGKVNLPLVDRIAAAESSNNPNAAAGTSSALGVGQFTRGTWLDLVGRYRPDLATGKTPEQVLELRRDPALSRDMIARLADDNGRAMQAANVPVNDATLYLAHFLGSGDAIKVLKADPNAPINGLVQQPSIDANQSVFARAPTAGALVAWAGRKVGVGEADLTQSREGIMALGMLKKDLGQDLTKRITDLNTAVARQELPDVGAVSDLNTLVHAVGTPDQQRRVAELGAMAEMRDRFATLPKAQRDAVVSSWLERGRAGAPQFDRNLAASLQSANQKIDAAYKTDPYGAYYQFGGGQTLAPIDLTQPQAAASILQTKVQQQNTIRADQNMEAFSVLRPGEAQAVRAALTQGDAASAGNILGALASLPPDIYKATMASEPMREAIGGLVRSYDPGKLNVAMTTLDRLWRGDPVGFKQAYGDETLRRLQTWQARKDALTPTQMVEYFQRADDPAASKARKDLLEQADEKLKKLSSSDVASALGGSWSLTPGLISRNVTGSDPLPPADPLAAATLTAEFRDLVRERYGDTGDIDKAKQQAAERLKTVWGPAVVNGGALMKYPPERFYPQVDGAYDWMRKDIEPAIALYFGKPRYNETLSVPGVKGEPVHTSENWSYRLLSDQQTEADVKSGRPPTYTVMVTDAATGRAEIVPASNGGPRRFAFDPAPAQAAAREEFGQRRQNIDRMRSEAAANVERMQAPMRALAGEQ